MKYISFFQININYRLLTSLSDLNDSIIKTFTDNIKIMALKKSRFIKKVKTKLMAVFQIIVIRPINLYLSLKINQKRKKKTIKLGQLVYIEKIV